MPRKQSSLLCAGWFRQGRQGQPSAVVMDGRTLQSNCESGPRAGDDGYGCKRGSKVLCQWIPWAHLLACMSPRLMNRSVPRANFVRASAAGHGIQGRNGSQFMHAPLPDGRLHLSVQCASHRCNSVAWGEVVLTPYSTDIRQPILFGGSWAVM